MLIWDNRKRERNRKDHGVDFADLERFFEGDLLTLEDARAAYGEERYRSIGILNGVPLLVVWTLRGEEPEEIRLISARKADRNEEAAWVRRYGKII
jgi:uncharacterized protein